ncbi:MAG: adenylate/guanylate cyclase domain-containing protein [Chloroflexota bacterium]|nr:adenylate/guanylate cyclase domain-containing protein [Chloroflexota bacterium]
MRFFAWPRRSWTLCASLCIGLAVTAVFVTALQGLPIFTRAELAAYDFQLQRRGPQPVLSSIVFVGVDNTSIVQLGGGSYPLARHWMARAIEFLHRAGARAIGVDFLYFRHTSEDRQLATAIKRAGNVVLADELGTPELNPNLQAEVQLEPPVPPIGSAAFLGVANLPVDADNIFRAADVRERGPAGSSLGSRWYPSFAAAVASVALHRSVAGVLAGLPVHLLINYVGPTPAGSAGGAFQPTQFYGIASRDAAALDDPAVFRGKIVILGCAAITCNDQKNSPFGPVFGGLIQANIVNTILLRNPIRPLGGANSTLVLLAIGLLTTRVASRFGIWLSSAATVALAIGYVGCAVVAFDHFDLWAPLVTPEIILILSFSGIMALRFATEERLKRRIHTIFGQYVKPEIVDILVTAPRAATLVAGVRRPISVLFVDIRGFTSMSETLAPEDVLTVLDIYLEELTSAVHRFDGTLDKYVGDELMAIWNAPRLQSDHPLLAVLCALEMQGRGEHINRQLRALQLPAVHFGIGVNTGEAVVGHMGSSFRKQYDVVGDAVNIGARLCSVAGKGDIIISADTCEMTGDHLDFVEQDPLLVKGKAQPLRTFRVVGESSKPTATPLIAPV